MSGKVLIVEDDETMLGVLKYNLPDFLVKNIHHKKIRSKTIDKANE